MASAGLAYSRGSAAEDVWKVATELQQARNLRRMPQPAPLQNNYRRDSLAREPFQSYRSGSVTREPFQSSYRRDSINRDPIPSYRRDSLTRDSVQDYKRASIATESSAFQSYRRDSLARDLLANHRRDSLARDSATRDTTPQSNGTTNGTTGRRGSDADDINWIEKYKRSDHHTDRMVSTKLDQQKAMAASTEDRPNHLNRSSSFSSSIPSSSSSSQSTHHHESPAKPFHYQGTNKLTVFLKPPLQTTTPRSHASSHVTLQTQPSSINQRRPSSETFSTSGLPPTSLTSSRSDYRSPFSSDRYSRPSSVLGSSSSSSLPVSSIFRRRNSVDSNMIKMSRSSSFSPVIPTSSNHSDYYRPSPTISSQSQPYRPVFSRAPSLPPPSLQSSRPPSTLPLPSTSLTTNGFSRYSTEGLTSNQTSRRYSLANISDLSTPNYRRSVDLSSLKSSTGGGYKSSNLSTYGSGLHRRGSYETMSSLSPFSPLSPLSPLSPSCLPPPSERIFGSRGTHTPLRRYRRSVADG